MALRDAATASHLESVARLAVRYGEALDLRPESLDLLHLAGRLHDIGKLCVPVELLLAPRPLDLIEQHTLRAHTLFGAQILRHAGLPASVCEIVEGHHELLDGSGYPHGLRGNAIRIETRILTVADVVDAMLSHRPYRPPQGVRDAHIHLLEGRGRWYDPAVVDVALALLEDAFDDTDDADEELHATDALALGA